MPCTRIALLHTRQQQHGTRAMHRRLLSSSSQLAPSCQTAPSKGWGCANYTSSHAAAEQLLRVGGAAGELSHMVVVVVLWQACRQWHCSLTSSSSSGSGMF